MAKKATKETSEYNRLAYWLEKRGKSMYWLAKNSEIGFATISKYVYGKREPTLPTLFKLADLLDVSPKDLLQR